MSLSALYARGPSDGYASDTTDGSDSLDLAGPSGSALTCGCCIGSMSVHEIEETTAYSIPV